MGITQSMGRVGSALDNAVIESWHSTLEFELRSLEHFTTKTAARAKVAAFIDDYNRDRRHSPIGGISPIAPRTAPAPPAGEGHAGLTGTRADRMASSSPASRPSPRASYGRP